MFEMSKTFMQTVASYVGRLQNHEFAEAAMATAAAVIWADCWLHAAEDAKLKQFIATSPLLQPFDPDNLLDIFEHYSEMHRIQAETAAKAGGLEGVQGAILRVADPDRRIELLKFGLVLAKADNPILQDDEEQVIRRLCYLLEIPAEAIFQAPPA
jgi:tellurite resistance protein